MYTAFKEDIASVAKLKKIWSRIKKQNAGKIFSQSHSAREEAAKLSACYICLKPSCYKVFKDKNATDNDHKRRRELCNSSAYKSKYVGTKVADTKTNEKKPSEEKKVDGNVTQI